MYHSKVSAQQARILVGLLRRWKGSRQQSQLAFGGRPMMDENPYRAPQTDSPVAKRSLPPRIWFGVACVAGQLAAYRIASLLPVPKWAVYLVSFIVWTAFVMAFVFVVRSFRPNLLKRAKAQP